MLDLSFLSSQACSTIVAFLAVILSQIPPLRVILKGPKIRIAGTDQFQLYHYLGNISLNFFLSIYNSGSRSVSISKIDCVIKNDEGLLLHLPAQRYLSRQLPSQPYQQVLEYFLGLIPLKPEETWSETIHCFSLWTQEEEKQVNDIVSKIRNDIGEKQKISTDLNVWVEANENIVNEAKKIFENKFNLEVGNYHLLIAVISESNQILATSGYNFNLYENHIQALRKCTERYKYGEGVSFPSYDPLASIFPRLKPITDELAMEEYKKIVSFLI